MKDLNEAIFFKLFKEVCEKCFGHPLTTPLSETDSKLLSAKIQEHTGLIIGVKSIRNYSLYIFNSKEEKKENPSVATLDTFARYVLDAQHTDEVQRKDKEGHHPYWFQYRRSAAPTRSMRRRINIGWRKATALGIILVTVVSLFVLWTSPDEDQGESFTDQFNSVLDDSLEEKGWYVKSMDSVWWSKRVQQPGHLSLYTLKGDNWQNAENHSGIRNLLVRSISSKCFTTEMHLSNFFPQHNWQQAGILLSEDSTFANKVIRLSISYNDFFGGYEKSPEILIQGLSSSEIGKGSKPEEFAHVSLFGIETGHETLVENNLTKSSLKIEKKGNHFRFLYATGSMESFAFKEAAHGDFTIQPRYIGLFAIRGFSQTENCMPVHFDSFGFATTQCGEQK